MRLAVVTDKVALIPLTSSTTERTTNPKVANEHINLCNVAQFNHNFNESLHAAPVLNIRRHADCYSTKRIWNRWWSLWPQARARSIDNNIIHDYTYGLGSLQHQPRQTPSDLPRFSQKTLVSTWWAGEMRAPLGGAGTTHHVYIIERLNNIMMFVLMIYLCVCGLSVLSPTAISLSLRLCLRIKQY